MSKQKRPETPYSCEKCDKASFHDKEWRAGWYYDYKKYQEDILYSRVNIFLLAVSILAAALVAVEGPWLRLLVASLGMVSTVLWLLGVERQRQIVADLRIQLKDADCLYNEMQDHRKARDGERKMRIPGQRLLFLYLPTLFGVFWGLAVVIAYLALR